MPNMDYEDYILKYMPVFEEGSEAYEDYYYAFTLHTRVPCRKENEVDFIFMNNDGRIIVIGFSASRVFSAKLTLEEFMRSRVVENMRTTAWFEDKFFSIDDIQAALDYRGIEEEWDLQWVRFNTTQEGSQ